MKLAIASNKSVVVIQVVKCVVVLSILCLAHRHFTLMNFSIPLSIISLLAHLIGNWFTTLKLQQHVSVNHVLMLFFNWPLSFFQFNYFFFQRNSSIIITAALKWIWKFMVHQSRHHMIFKMYEQMFISCMEQMTG